MTDTSGGSEDDTEDEFISDFEQSFCNEISDHLYLFIETLTGTSFEMKVSPFETIISIKAKLQQLEGIPVTQQHLLYNNTELANNLSLYECEVPDGATLKLVLSMRGGPINTKKIPLHEESVRDLQEVMERSKEELLEHIPEGGHVTVLVFRDGDQINLYHVLERADGSYSPLSDSWSGSSIKNLFAEQDDPEVQERLQENANTMSKMQELRNKIQVKQSKKKKKSRIQSKENIPLTPLDRNLAPLERNAKTESDELHFKDLTSVTQVHKNSNHFQSRNMLKKPDPLPKVRSRTSSNFTETPPSTAASFSLKTSTKKSYEHSSEPKRVNNNKKLISLDVSDLKRKVDETIRPALVSKQKQIMNAGGVSRGNRKLSESISNNNSFDTNQRLYSPATASFLTSSFSDSLKKKPSDNLMESKMFTKLGPIVSNEKSKVPSLELDEDNNNDQHQAKEKQISFQVPEARGLESRLLNSRRGRLKSLASPVRRTVLASPKLNSPGTPKTSAGKLRPSYATRPLSGPKRRKSAKKRCCQGDCRKKLNITNSFSCRCNQVFCALHRHPESHVCSYDYKTEGRKLLEAANPLVTIPKLPKI